MSINFNFPSITTNQKAVTVPTITEAKSAILDSVTVNKQQQHSSINDSITALTRSVSKVADQESRLPDLRPEENLIESAARGAGEAIKGVPMLGHGIVAGGATVSESIFGEGGASTDLKNYAVGKYQDWEESVGKYAQPEDSFTYSYNKAKEGDIGALISWASHGTGYVASQLATMLTGVGIAEKGTELLGKKAVGSLMGKLVENEAKRTAQRQLGKGASKEAIKDLANTEAIVANATSTIAGKVGQQIGAAGLGFGMEAGEIGGDLAAQTIERGTPLTGKEIAKGLTATALAGSVEYLENILGLKAVSGKLSKLPGAKVEDIRGISGKLARGTVTAGKVSTAEFLQEYVQTGLEQFGKGQDIQTDEAALERFDAAMLGALSGGPTGVIAATRSTQEEQSEAAQKRQDKAIARTRADYKKKVDTAVIDDTKLDEFIKSDPVVAADALNQRNQKEDITPTEAIANYDKALEVQKSLTDQLSKVDAEIQAIDPESTPTEAEYIKIKKLFDDQKRLVRDLEDVDTTLKAMSQTDATPTDLQKEVKKGDNLDETIVKVMGSKSGGRDLGNYIDYEGIVKNPNISQSTKDLITSVSTLNESDQAITDYKEEIVESTKGFQEVHSDIMEGGTEGNKGITAYMRDITTLLDDGDTKGAKVQHDRLKQFADDHTLKTETFQAMEDSFKEKKTPPKEVQSQMQVYNQKRTSKGLEPYAFNTIGMRNIIGLMQLESTALNNAIATSDLLFKQFTTTKEEVVEQPSPRQGRSQKVGKKVSEASSPSEQPKSASKESAPSPTSEQADQKGADVSKNKKAKPVKKKLPTKAEFIKYLKGLTIPQLKSAQKKVTSTQWKNYIQELLDKDSPKVITNKELTEITENDPGEFAADKLDKTKLRKDKLKTFNWIKVFFNAGKKRTTDVINSTTGAIQSLKDNLSSLDAKSKEAKMQSSMLSYIEKSNDSLDQVVRTDKPKQKRYEDPIFFLAQETDKGFVLPESVKTAISAASYNWLTGTGQGTVSNDADAIRQSLRIDPNNTNIISDKAFNALSDAGSSEHLLKPILGREIFKLLNLDSIKDTPTNMQEEIELSLGAYALANMQYMKMLKRKDFFIGDNKFGLKRLANDILNNKISSNQNYELLAGTDRKGKSVSSFFAVDLDNTKKLVETNSLIKDGYHKIFYGEENTHNYSWTKPKRQSQMTIERSNEKLSEGQTKRLQMNQEEPYTLNRSVADTIGLLTPERQYLLAGGVDPSLVHKDKRDGTEAKNRNITYSFNTIQAWTEQAEDQGGLDTEFYIPQVFQKNTRMRQVGDIRPQANKIMRNMFALKNSFMRINLNNTTKVDAFIEGVGVSLGIESYKVGGKAAAIEQTKSLLSTDTVQEALESVDVLLEGEDLSEAQFEALLAGVKIGGEDLLSFRGLVEYQRFLRTDSTEIFQTNLPLEVDGSANGAIISLMQFSTKLTDKIKNMLRAGGLSFKDEPNDQSIGKYTNDPYESIAISWSSELAIMKQDMSKEELVRFEALESLIGGISNLDPNAIESSLRGLTKDSIMGSLYGTGKKGLIAGLTNLALMEKAIYKGIAKHAADGNLEGLADIRNGINTIVGKNVFMPKGKAEFTVQDYLESEFTDTVTNKLSALMGEYHGNALDAAVNSVYGEIQEFSKVLNRGVKIATANYNAAYKWELQEITKTKEVVTIKDIQVIRKKLDHMLPRLKTSFGEYLPLYSFEQSGLLDKNADTLEHNFAPKGLVRLTSKAKTKDVLGSPGLKGTVTAVHMLDASVANLLMGEDIPFLNVHDGFIGGAYDASNVSNKANKHFSSKMEFYSVSKALTELLVKSDTDMKKFIKSTGAELDIKAEFNSLDNFKLDKEDKIADVTLATITESISIGTKTSAFKKDLYKQLEAVNQYYHSEGAHYLVDPISANPDTLGDELITDVKSSSKGAESMSVKVDDYVTQQEINSQNVTDTYNQIKNKSSATGIVDSPKHDEHLQRILNSIVSKVLRPVDLYMKDNPNIETEGKRIVTENGTERIFLSSQTPGGQKNSGALAQGIRMSTGEVYTHELLHAVLSSGLRLNGNLRRQVERLYTLANKNIDYKAFLNNPNINVNDPSYKYEVQAAKDRYDYIFTTPSVNKDGTSNHLDEFITIGLTNENFINALSKVPLDQTSVNWGKLKGKDIQETLVNIGKIIMDFFYEKFTVKGQSPNIAKELEQLALLLSQIDSRNKSALFEAVTKIDKVQRKVYDKANKLIKDSFNKIPTVKVVSQLAKAKNKILYDDSYLGQQLRNMKDAHQRSKYGIAKAVATEMIGKTGRLEPLYDLLSSKKNIKESKKVTIISLLRSESASLLSKATDRDKVTVTKVLLKTDMVALLDTFGLAEITKMLRNEDKIQANIDALMSQVRADKALRPLADYYQNSTDAMGYFMVHSRARSNSIPILSTRPIASGINTTIRPNLNPSKLAKAEKIVDQLGSLYALKYSAKDRKAELANMIDENSEGVNGVMRYHQILKEDALRQEFKGNKNQFIKGFTPQMLDPRIEFRYGTLSDEEEFKSQGLHRRHKIQRDPNEPTKNTDIYVYTANINRINNYDSKIAYLSNNKARGTSTTNLAKQLGLDSATGKRNTQTVIRRKSNIISNMEKANHSSGKSGNFMIPQVDANGIIVDYRYMMSEQAKDDYMNQVLAFDAILGQMAGTLVDKNSSIKINPQLVDALKDIYDEEYQNNIENYVEISASSSDANLREIWYMLPDHTRQYVKQKWGQSKMMVAKDVLAIAFGDRRYSIVESFAKSADERNKLERVIVILANWIFKENAIKAVSTVEEVAITLTNIAKDNIVVRSLTLALNNLGSNFMYLKARGVPTSTILKYAREAIVMGIKYQADKNNLNKAVLKKETLLREPPSQSNRQAIKKLNTEIIKLEDAIARNPTTTTIEAGLMPALVEDIDTDATASDFPNFLEEFADKQFDKLPKPVQNVGKVLFLSQDTKGYKLFNNAVKMTDFIGRHVLYNHYTAKGMSHKDAVLAAEEEFVNFNQPTHRMIEWLNAVGIVRFSKYFLRIQKIIYNAIKDKPFDAGMSLLMSESMGWDNIANSAIGVKDLGMNVGDPVNLYFDSADNPYPISFSKDLIK